MKKILFLCTGNSCRSQMAEGWGKKIFPQYEIFSAGITKHGLNPHAIQVMKEEGVDISHQTSQTIEEHSLESVDLVVTVCSDAHENCPYYPGKKVIHRGFDDPPRLTKDVENEEERLSVYRRVRDEIKEMVSGLEREVEGI